MGQSSPDHDKQFDVEVPLNGTSKKRAEQAAAKATIEALFPGKIYPICKKSV